MKKKIFLTTTLFILLFSVGCAKAEETQIQDSEAEIITEQPSEEKAEKEDPEMENPVQEQQEVQQSETQQSAQQPVGNAGEEFQFADLADRYFYFSSGAGGWHTELFINSDGSFRGTYMDFDMGDSDDAYPDGTIYYCEFTGMFDRLEKIDAFTWKMYMTDITSKQEYGKEEIVDGTRYIDSSAYGLVGGEEFYLYLPGAALSDLPESYRGWVGYYNLDNTTETVLPYYGLYNVNTGDGFSSYEYEEKSLSERIALEISFAEEWDAQLREELQNAASQTDMNLTAQELYQTWDNTLNIVWKLLESELDDAQMEALREEERTWIASKEEVVNAVSQEYEGGSTGSMETSLKAAELTKERVYELAEYGRE